MKRLFFICLLTGLFASCSNDSKDNDFESQGTIKGIDMLHCACHCGGYFIEINNTTYRFNEDSLIENSIHLSTASFPLRVYLDWEAILPDSSCSATDRITVQRIQSAD